MANPIQPEITPQKKTSYTRTDEMIADVTFIPADTPPEIVKIRSPQPEVLAALTEA